MKNKNTIPLKEALEDFLKEKKWGIKIKGYQITSHWGDLVAREIAQNSQPIKIQN